MNQSAITIHSTVQMEPPPAFPKPGSAMVIRNVQMAVMKPKPCAVSLSHFVIQQTQFTHISLPQELQSKMLTGCYTCAQKKGTIILVLSLLYRKEFFTFQEIGLAMMRHSHVTAVFQNVFHRHKSATNMQIVQMEVMSQPGCVVCILTI